MTASDELADELGIGELGRRDLASDAASLDDEHPRAQRRDEVEILLDQDETQAATLPQPAQGVRDEIDDRGLDAFRRLVEKHETRLSAQAAGHRQDLLLATAELSPEAVQQRLEPR